MDRKVGGVLAALAVAGSLLAWRMKSNDGDTVSEKAKASANLAPQVGTKVSSGEERVQSNGKAPTRAEQARQKLATLTKDRREQTLVRMKAARELREKNLATSTAPPVPDLIKTGDAQSISVALREVFPLITECFRAEETPPTEGLLRVHFGISGEKDIAGLVDNVWVEDKAELAKRPHLQQCLEDVVYPLEFPPPSGGGSIEVSLNVEPDDETSGANVELEDKRDQVNN